MCINDRNLLWKTATATVHFHLGCWCSLTYTKNNMSVDSQLSEKNLTSKLTMLLVLFSAYKASSNNIQILTLWQKPSLLISSILIGFMKVTEKVKNHHRSSTRNIPARLKPLRCEYIRRVYCQNREVEIWRRALPTFFKFYPPSQTCSFFLDIWIVKNYPHEIR